MNLIEFENSKGVKVLVNPVNIAYILPYKNETTIIYFNSSGAGGQTYIVVKGSVEQTALKLTI